MLQDFEKTYVSVPELAKRWKCAESEVCALIWRGELVPSWYFSEYDPYPLYELTEGVETDGLTGVQVEGHIPGVEEITDIFTRHEGYQFLILPKKTSPTTCDFWMFASTSGPFYAGDFVQHLKSPISLLDVKERGVVMFSEVEKCESLICHANEVDCQTRHIKPVSRSAAQETFVLTLIESMGLDPKKLPKNQPGIAGVKAKIRQAALLENQIFSGGKTFDKSWERLSERRDIAYKK